MWFMQLGNFDLSKVTELPSSPTGSLHPALLTETTEIDVDGP